ncbi:MAG: XRE family transcriptional regulator [Sphingomonadales bacterium]|nr:MAG: XRE family transcriptional regulator [Sphingomonadales bacterium]
MADQPHPIDVHVGMRLRARRRILGMTQEKLGELLGLTFQQVQKYERGANRIGSSRLFELSQILQTPVSYFFEGMSGEASAAAGVAEPTEGFEHDSLASKETQDLLRHYYRISDQKTRRKLLDLIRSIGTDPGVA